MVDSWDDREREAVVVGTGRVGAALIRILPRRGIRVRAVVSRDPARARELVGGAAPILRSMSEAVRDPGLLILAVPDDQLEHVAGRLASEIGDGDVACAMHTSGTHPSDILHPLRMAGAELLSFHPVVAFPPRHRDEDPFAGAGATLEGSEAAVNMGVRLAERLGCHPIAVTGEQKKAVHVAAAIAANFSTALVAAAEALVSEAGLGSGDARRLIIPLMQSVTGNLAEASPGEALTGPIVRGDLDVVRQHVDLLSHIAPHLVPLYRLLGRTTVDLAVQSGRIPKEVAEAMGQVLAD